MTFVTTVGLRLGLGWTKMGGLLGVIIPVGEGRYPGSLLGGALFIRLSLLLRSLNWNRLKQLLLASTLTRYVHCDIIEALHHPFHRGHTSTISSSLPTLRLSTTKYLSNPAPAMQEWFGQILSLCPTFSGISSCGSLRHRKMPCS